MKYQVPGLPQALVDAFAESPELPTPLPPDPFPLLKAWFDEAKAAKHVPNPDAISLATVGPGGEPSCRIVLCRGIDVATGRITFFTNDQGRKGTELASSGRAAVVFHHDHWDRQVRVEGLVVKSPDTESDAYFYSRRWESRLSAWTSDQSRPTQGRAELLAKMATVIQRLGIDPNTLMQTGPETKIPRPPHWGGWRLHATRCELWLGGTGRLHDRAQWTREFSGIPDQPGTTATPWHSTRLQP
jgi:pyridoxamine 5'-phosphate oxidase